MWWSTGEQSMRMWDYVVCIDSYTYRTYQVLYQVQTIYSWVIMGVKCSVYSSQFRRNNILWNESKSRMKNKPWTHECPYSRSLHCQVILGSLQLHCVKINRIRVRCVYDKTKNNDSYAYRNDLVLLKFKWENSLRAEFSFSIERMLCAQ